MNLMHQHLFNSGAVTVIGDRGYSVLDSVTAIGDREIEKAMGGLGK